MRRDEGSLLLVTLISVSVVTLLALALGGWMRAQGTLLEGGRQRRAARAATYRAAVMCLAERIVAESNRWDALSQPWAAEPWEWVGEGWRLRVSGHGWDKVTGDATGLVDENGKLPLEKVPEPVLSALFRRAANVPEARAADYARRVVAWRAGERGAPGELPEAEPFHNTDDIADVRPVLPFVCVEELYAIPGIDPEHLDAVRTFLTVAGNGLVNINTATEPVLRAAFAGTAAGDGGAAARLLERVLGHRRGGGHFTGAAAATIGRELGGLPADEAALLGRLEPFITVRSTAVSGLAEAQPETIAPTRLRGARSHFIWNRESQRFVRWIEE